MFRPKGNRRRVDIAKKVGEAKAAARSFAPTALKIFVAICATVLLAWGGQAGWQWATTAPYFALTQIRFTGNSRATDAELQRLGGLFEGQNVVSMNVGSIERSMQAHPWVNHLSVKRKWHSEIEVEVVENRPVAVISLGDLYLVSDEAKPFKKLQALDGLDLPLITGIDREAMNTDREGSEKLLKSAIEIAAAYAAVETAKVNALSEVHVEADAVSLTTINGQEILLGLDQLDSKLARLAKVRRELQARSLTAEVIRLDNRVRPDWVSVQLSPSVSEKTPKAGK